MSEDFPLPPSVKAMMNEGTLLADLPTSPLGWLGKHAPERKPGAGRWIEWPPGTGRWAFYSPAASAELRRVATRTVVHRDGCPAAEGKRVLDEKYRDGARCDYCANINETIVLHEIRIYFGEAEVEETTVLNAAAGDALREEAIGRVTANAPGEWKEAALAVLDQLSALRDEFTTDDVWDELAKRKVDPPPERRAMAAPVREAQRRGWIEKTTKFSQSEIPHAHRRNTQVWRSLRRQS